MFILRYQKIGDGAVVQLRLDVRIYMLANEFIVFIRFGNINHRNLRVMTFNKYWKLIMKYLENIIGVMSRFLILYKGKISQMKLKPTEIQHKQNLYYTIKKLARNKYLQLQLQYNLKNPYIGALHV